MTEFRLYGGNRSSKDATNVPSHALRQQHTTSPMGRTVNAAVDRIKFINSSSPSKNFNVARRSDDILNSLVQDHREQVEKEVKRLEQL